MLREKDFLISLAIGQFNRQFGKNLQIADCEIRTIPVRYSAHRSYEVYTSRNDDNVRLHIHMSFGGRDGVRPYTLQVDGTQNGSGVLTDEVYVSVGDIDPYYVNEGIYKFLPLNSTSNMNNFLLMENGDPILLENGQPIVLEAA